MDIRSKFRTQDSGNGRTLLNIPSRTVGSGGLGKGWASRNIGVKADIGEGRSSEQTNWN